MIATTITPTRQLIAEKLHDLLDDAPRGSKSRFARRCGVDPAVVTRWLDGVVNIDAGTIDTIAEAAGLTQSELFDEKVRIPQECILTD